MFTIGTWILSAKGWCWGQGLGFRGSGLVLNLCHYHFIIGYILELYWDNGKEHGNYYKDEDVESIPQICELGCH